MMVGVASMRVVYPDEPAYKHCHCWLSEGWLHAPVELREWIRETEEEQGCKLEVVSWELKARTDIGV